MALDPNIIESLDSPYLYHTTDIKNIASILRDGLKPGTERGVKQIWAKGRWQTRPGCVYIAEQDYIQSFCHAHGGGVLRIDLRLLDASKLIPDEDSLDLYNWTSCYPECEQDAFSLLCENFPECFYRGMDGLVRRKDSSPLSDGPQDCCGLGVKISLGSWAEQNALELAKPCYAKHSLQYGTLAHEGTIDPAAIDIVPERLLELIRKAKQEKMQTLLTLLKSQPQMMAA